MRKEAGILFNKAINSLILSIEQFNRPWDIGRVDAFLMLLDHSFEMLLKASILHRGGKIREKRAKQTIGFDACVRKALSDGDIKFLTGVEALTLQAINSFRDAAQHHIVDISENHLYIHAQAGLTLFRDICNKVFSIDVKDKLPIRVLPISTTPPTDFATLFDNEVTEIKKLLKPGKRRKIEASAKLRALAILDASLKGERLQPSQSELQRIGREISLGKSWNEIFSGVASINLSAEGSGPSIQLRITKKEGIPIHFVKEGSPDAAIVAVKRVDELGYYNLNLTQLSEKVALTGPKALVLVRHLKLQDDPEYFKQIIIGKTKFNRYSQKAIDRIRKELPVVSMDKIWKQYGPKRSKKQ